MKVILSPDMANELIQNEDSIRNEKGAYRPQYREFQTPNYVSINYVSVIKCFPLEKVHTPFIQERDVIPGMENEVDDICMAKIDNNIISGIKLKPSYMQKYSIYIYEPTFTESPIFLTSETLPDLFDQMKKYRLGLNNDNDLIKSENDVDDVLNKIFTPYKGICTYILFRNMDIIRCGKI